MYFPGKRIPAVKTFVLFMGFLQSKKREEYYSLSKQWDYSLKARLNTSVGVVLQSLIKSG